MLYWTPVEVRAFLRRWAVLKALIAAAMMVLPTVPALDPALASLDLFRNTVLMFWYVMAGAVWVWGCADYSRSKGYSGWWGLLCAPLPLGPFGLIALFLFPDKWDPKHLNWRPESDPLLIDGVRMPSARDARHMLRNSWTRKLGMAATLWGVVMLFTMGVRHWISNDSWPTLQMLTIGCAFGACFIGTWGAAHLARYKGYNTLWALVGFALLPIAIALTSTSGPDTAIIALTLIAFLLGPIVLLFMPDQWHDVGISPIAYNPNEMSDLSQEPVFVDRHNVRIVNPY